MPIGEPGIKAHIRIYPLSQAASPPATTFVNVSGKAFNTIHAMDFTYFDEVKEVIQEEPTTASDPETLVCLPPLALRRANRSRPMSG
jgi:hypothetical protein